MFERRTKNGLTESLCFSEKNMIRECDMRFSVLSPNTVIRQTLNILKEINKKIAVKILDLEIYNQLYLELMKNGEVDRDFKGIEGTGKEENIRKDSFISLDVDEFINNEFNIRKRNIILNNVKGKVIESDGKTINYIKKKKKTDKYFGWIKEFIK